MNKTITVVDSIMGSGKTNAIIDMINNNPETNYIYITPYLDEIKRVADGTHHRLKRPWYHDGLTKQEDLHRLLALGKSIATTHALFLRANAETIQLIHEGGYTLIMDEAVSTLREFNEVVEEMDGKQATEDDIRLMLESGIISVNAETLDVIWEGVTAEGSHYSEIERLAKNKTLKCVGDKFYWEYPPDVFRAFEKIYVLTYLFDSSMMAGYFTVNGFEYEKISVQKTEDGVFSFCEYVDSSVRKDDLIPLINIYEGQQNELGNARSAFSINWLKRQNGDGIKAIQNAMRSYKKRMKAKSSDILWTTTKQYDIYKKFEAVYGFKYTKKIVEKEMTEDEIKKERCFLAFNARATNDFDKRRTLLYLINVYLQPDIRNYYLRRGFSIDEDRHALSEMVQWIWRSAIRKGYNINLFIPSSRMRNLLKQWLEG